MSLKPIDLQVNINSTIAMSQREGARLAIINHEKRDMEHKIHEQHKNIDEKVSQMEETADSNSAHKKKVIHKQVLSDQEEGLSLEQKKKKRIKSRGRKNFEEKRRNLESADYENQNSSENGVNFFA